MLRVISVLLVLATATTADNYANNLNPETIVVASSTLEASGTDVPWSIRVRQKDFQWHILMWVGLLSLVIGIAAGLYLLVLVALPGQKSGLRGTQRVAGIIKVLQYARRTVSGSFQKLPEARRHM